MYYNWLVLYIYIYLVQMYKLNIYIKEQNKWYRRVYVNNGILPSNNHANKQLAIKPSILPFTSEAPVKLETKLER